jgi:hypothetical protein
MEEVLGGFLKKTPNHFPHLKFPNMGRSPNRPSIPLPN